MVKQTIALTCMLLTCAAGAAAQETGATAALPAPAQTASVARAESTSAAAVQPASRVLQTPTQAAPAGAAPGVREAAGPGETTEGHLPKDVSYTPWLLDPSVFGEDQGDRTEKRQVPEKEVKTVKVANLVPPIHFRTGDAEITREYLDLLRGVLEKMRGRQNVRLHFVGHADSQRLSPALQSKFTDNTGLSRERAGTTAEYCQRALGLPPEAISYEGLGDTRPVASNLTEEGRAQNRRVEVEVWYDEIGEKMVEKEVIVPATVHRVKVCRTETVCKMRYKEGLAHRVRLKHLVAPMHYDAALVTVPDEFLRQVRQALDNLKDKQNVAVRFTAYGDNAPLEARDERIYGDQIGLSRAVARRVALAVQDALKEKKTLFESDGKGSVQPVATNDTPQGRGLNRRVEVEFLHDDPLQELPDEPQLCPEDAGSETVTRVYDPPSGPVAPILFADGNPVLPAGYTERLTELMAQIRERANVRLRFTGYIENERLDRRNAAIYGDDVGWATARARRSMLSVSEKMGLPPARAEFEGRGYVQSDDVVATGFTGTGASRVEVQVIYDEKVPVNDYEGVDILRMTREVNTVDPLALNLMRISVDGKPVDDLKKSVPDLQRCTDLALDRAEIQFRYDDLKAEPRLNVTAWPRSVAFRVEGGESDGNLVRFRLYSNYHSFIKRGEVRIFDKGVSERDLPLAVVPLDGAGEGEWRASFDTLAAPVRELKYLVRVYDAEGNFDETVPQPLWVIDHADPAAAKADPERELLAGYGGSRIAARNIPVAGGSVLAHGSAIPKGHRVWLAGYPAPVDGKGRFIAEEILPKGTHTVEVAVLDQAGNGELYLRDLAMKKNDWFTVGIADLTLSANKTSGPAELVAPDRPQYGRTLDAEGRLAFYTKGSFGDGWGLTASADTREGPLNEIFSNFLEKSPEALLRRMDQDYHLPTYGDDGTVTEDAPTSGKFYAKLAKHQNYALWGNFRVGYTDNDLAHVDRGLYGGNLHYQLPGVTGFGEKRFVVDGFAAEPGTMAGRDEFRGTGGSLYYLRRQDILQGSDRVRIEVRDKDSGMVLATKELTAVQDYDVDYLQGRLVLNEPLESTASDNLLVHSDAIGGNPVYLVARYEYTPGVTELDSVTFGGRAHYWFGDHVKLGVTGNKGDDGAEGESLVGGDLTLRKSAATWLKLETGRSRGTGLFTSNSQDGGFKYGEVQTPGDKAVSAGAYRLDASVGLADLGKDWRGRITLYSQLLEAGYTAPGQIAERETLQAGGTAEIPVTDRVKLTFKGDHREVDQGLQTTAAEADAQYQVDEHWTASVGGRVDHRKDESAIVPITQETGTRTDLVGKVAYDSKARWMGYLFTQQSVQTSGNREDNARTGAGGAYRVTDRFKVNGELSAGDQGVAGRFGAEYLYSDRTTLYMNYALENERSDNGVQARKGTMASGFRSRYSDTTSVYGEERYTHGDTPSGLLHAYGVDLTPTDRLNLGAKGEVGTLKDNLTGAELKRTAVGVNAGYGFDKVKLASAVEYRVDDAEQTNPEQTVLTREKRTTWLFKNSLKYQMTPDWRLIGKFNYSKSTSSEGDLYDGSYTEAVIGYAYRPVANDRLNALVKYTYFYNMPSAEQITGTTTGASFMQRSHIASIDAMYDLTPRWTVGGKYAYRLGQVSMDRVNPEYFDSRAHLVVARVDWRFLHKWDALVEGRLLDLPDARDSRTGVLLGVYRHLGNHFKIGAGYNFSDFSDDLTDLSYRRQGVFVNMVGMI